MYKDYGPWSYFTNRFGQHYWQFNNVVVGLPLLNLEQGSNYNLDSSTSIYHQERVDELRA